MGKRSSKYIIGLTGNIGTGKSLVRRMLEHLGAYGIDADALSHRAIAKGAPAYRPVVNMFGQWILTPDGEIDRAKLGRIVFADPVALHDLEVQIHPLVLEAVSLLIRRASQPVVVIEAIKLFESPLREICDSLWVVTCPPEVQLRRLVEKRKMLPADAKMRVEAQPPQSEKTAMADVVINNGGSYDDTWKAVMEAWHTTIPGMLDVEPEPEQGTPQSVGAAIQLAVRRAGSRDAADMAEFLSQTRGNQITTTEVVESFGEKGYFLLMAGAALVGVMGWQVENLVARGLSFDLDSSVPLISAVPLWVTEMEKAAAVLQAEAALMFVPMTMSTSPEVWGRLGYQIVAPKDLTVRAWQEAAQEAMPPGTTLFFKQLRMDRILRPI